MVLKKLHTSELLRRVDAGDSFADIAKDHGISRQAVQKRVRLIRGRTTRVTAAKKVEQVVEQKLDAIRQLHKINENANELLDLCMALSRGDEIQDQHKVWIGGEEYKTKDPRELALRAMAEIRGQLKLQLEIFAALYDLKAAKEFQEEVLQAIGKVAPDVRRKIIHQLNKRRAVRSAVRFS